MATKDKTEKKIGDEFTLMRQIYDNLQLLNYETEFKPLERKLPYLTPLYFVLPARSSKEQFDYFAHLCTWMLQKFFGSNIETPTDYDTPTAIADNILIKLPDAGFKINFSSSKLLSGNGQSVLLILDSLSRGSLTKSGSFSSKLRIISGIGGGDDDEEVKTIDDDESALLDDVIEVPDDIEINENSTPDYINDLPNKIIDPLDLKKEAEKVANRLQIRIPAEKSDWRTHFSQMNQYQKNISDLMSQLSPILSKVGADVTKAIEAIDTREKTLNNRFETSVIEYSNKAKSLENIEKKHRERVTSVNNLQTELNNVIDKLSKTKNALDEKQKETSDNSPLIQIKDASQNLKEEIKKLELRSAILQRTLTQTWLEDKKTIDH